MRKWEYKVLKEGLGLKGFSPDKIEEELNLWGEEGWELVAIERQQSSLLAVLKRPVGGTPRRREPKDHWF
jgi:hypothetical protein